MAFGHEYVDVEQGLLELSHSLHETTDGFPIDLALGNGQGGHTTINIVDLLSSLSV